MVGHWNGWIELKKKTDFLCSRECSISYFGSWDEIWAAMYTKNMYTINVFFLNSYSFSFPTKVPGHKGLTFRVKQYVQKS